MHLAREGKVRACAATTPERLAKPGSAPEPQERATPEAHRTVLDAEPARWRPILQAAGEFAD
jgi:hypothetical protein